MRPFMPAFGSEEWRDRAMGAGEASSWLRSIVGSVGSSGGKISSHSLKVTLLSWMAKSGGSMESRRLLGYHAAPGDRSLRHYSRDALSGPLAELEKVLGEVRAGKFRPDHTRSGYRRPRVAEGSEDTAVTESEGNSSETSTCSSEEETESDMSTAMAKHKKLETIHLVNKKGDKTMCGGLISESYEDVEVAMEWAKTIGCLQCFGHDQR